MNIMKVLKLVLVILPMVIIIGLVFYFQGIKKLGTPAEFKQKQLELIQARLDSIKKVESSKLLPENIADSTLFSVGRHTGIFEDNKQFEDQLKAAQTTLDSLEKEKNTLDAKEKSIDAKINNLNTISQLAEDKNINNLAKIYDAMKTPQAVPLFTSMDDSLAVAIISLMQQRNASKLLGAIAEKDVEKAARLNKLLAEIGK
ncbi:MAG: hypothetical protein JXB48_00405 [Candidatus Latescibacteria bacterium]|nr:hypothetical protein [Candidatus Latescibacterota bacterium]